MIRRPPRPTLFPYFTFFCSFFFNDTATTEIYTLSLHDALPICGAHRQGQRSRPRRLPPGQGSRSEEHTSELQSLRHLVCRLLLEKKSNAKMSSGRGSRNHTAGSSADPHRCARLAVQGALFVQGLRDGLRPLQLAVSVFLRQGGPPDFSPFPQQPPSRI